MPFDCANANCESDVTVTIDGAFTFVTEDWPTEGEFVDFGEIAYPDQEVKRNRAGNIIMMTSKGFPLGEVTITAVFNSVAYDAFRLAFINGKRCAAVVVVNNPCANIPVTTYTDVEIKSTEPASIGGGDYTSTITLEGVPVT